MTKLERFIVFFLPASRRYTYAMMRAINKAREPCFVGETWASKADGLRVIRRFELVNKTAFNPFLVEHINTVAFQAAHEQFFRRCRYDFARSKKG